MISQRHYLHHNIMNQPQTYLARPRQQNRDAVISVTFEVLGVIIECRDRPRFQVPAQRGLAAGFKRCTSDKSPPL